MVAKIKPDIEALAGDFYDLEELATERLHQILVNYGIEEFRDVCDRLKHGIDCDVAIAMRRHRD
jgi:hypothetical protein